MIRPIIIDCDTGADDAIAILMALASPEAFNVLGITTVGGNAPLDYTQKNTRKICELAGRPDIKVFAGCPRPMLRKPINASYVHGETGMEGANLPEPIMPLQKQHAVDFLIETLLNTKQKITLAVTGPHTNIAVAIIKEPRILENIEEIIMMGGSLGAGNITSAAEFNMYADPHAAEVVFSSGVKITMIGLDITHRVATTPERLQTLRSLGTLVGEQAAAIMRCGVEHDQTRFATIGRAVHDACVTAYLLNPKLFVCKPAKIHVEIAGELSMGATIVSTYPAHTAGVNTQVAVDVDENATFDLIIERLSRFQDQKKAVNGGL